MRKLVVSNIVSLDGYFAHAVLGAGTYTGGLAEVPATRGSVRALSRGTCAGCVVAV